MNKIILLILFSLSSLAMAKSPYEICDGLFSSTDKIKCLEIVKGKHFDPAATDICGNLFSSVDKVSCLQVIANKVYRPEEVRICSSIFSSADKVNCLLRTGDSTFCPSNAKAQSDLTEILSLISSSNYRAAYRTASSLLERFEACQ